MGMGMGVEATLPELEDGLGGRVVAHEALDPGREVARGEQVVAVVVDAELPRDLLVELDHRVRELRPVVLLPAAIWGGHNTYTE